MVARLDWLTLTTILLAGIIGGAAEAGTITVSTTAELVAAIDAAQPGDVIELVDGIYQLSTANGIVVQGKSNLTIRGRAGNRDAVVIRGQGINAASTGFVFKVFASPDFTLQDLTMKDVYWHHVQINDGSERFTLRNLVMLDAGEAPVKVTSPGGSGPFSDDGLIENCWLGFSTHGMRGVVEGIDIIASARTIVRNNEFYRVIKKAGPNNVGWGVFAKCNAEDTIIENNYFEDNDIAISFGNGGCPATYARYGDVTYQHRGGIIRNNVVNRTKDNAVHINSSKDYKIYNNTLWSTFSAGKSSIDVRFNSNGDIFNNLSSEGVRLREGGTASFAANVWFVDSSFFVDQPAGDFHLVSNATAAIDNGVDTLADVPYDMDGRMRPSGVAIDIGADELNCGDGVQDVTEECDDGNAIDGDGCDNNCTPTACGNGVTTAGEQCDDGNTLGGDCCDASCTFEPLDSQCDDGSACSRQDVCDGSGRCAGNATPLPVCRAPLEAARSKLTMTDRGTGGRLSWKWAKGAETSLDSLGDPTAKEGYTFCLFDAGAGTEPLIEARLPAGGGWGIVNRGFRYRDKQETPDGILAASLRAGGDGRAKATVKGKGQNLRLPAIPLPLPVTVQLRNDSGECWGATFSAAARNVDGRFRAKSD